MKCRSCSNVIKPFFSLGKMPLVNSFLTKKQLIKEKKYDLTVAFCEKCYLVQLVKIVSPNKLFSNYVYFSSTSSLFLKHCEETAVFFKRKLDLNSNSLVVEIASNDGAQLLYFKKVGARILGIDPAKNIAAIANKKGVKTLPEFFNLKFAQKLRSQGVIADLIFGANILAHVPEIVDFVKGVSLILKPRGTASFEFPYLRGLLENKFDTIYHEHVFYYSLLALENLFSQAGMEIYDLEITPMQGGSLRILASHQGNFPINRRVTNLREYELRNRFNKLTTYKKINKNIVNLKRRLLGKLNQIKKNRKHIAAYSAPAKGNILLNYYGIADNYLDFIVDKAKEKQGLYTPGTHMLVYSPDKIYENRPDYLLVLCWNIADEVIKQQDKYRKLGGKFIIPIPKLKII